MISRWKIWVDAKSEEKARRVFARALNLMECHAQEVVVEPYPKINGFVIRFDTELESERWSDCVIEVIALGQRVASGWSLYGNIKQDPAASSTGVSVSGAVMIEWRLIDTNVF